MSRPLVSAAAARAFLVRRHMLAPPRALPATTESVMEVVDRLGSLQFDPLEVPGARNHELVLHARIAAYRRGLCERLLYGEPRLLFEAYNKSLNLLPVSELASHRLAWKRAMGRNAGAVLARHRSVAKMVLARIARDGPLSSAAFEDTGTVASYWGTSTTVARHVLDALFETGKLGIARREGNRRFYDRIERLLPREALSSRAPDERAAEHRLLSRHRAVGLMGQGGGSELLAATDGVAERRRRLARLVARGALIEVEVEGLKGTRHVLPYERALLDDGSTIPPHVTYLAPLDPLLWDRRMMRELFGFEYTWEVYTPPEKRTHGYYVLPLLFRDALVGRCEPRFDRASKTLTLAGVWLEKGFDPDVPGFAEAMADALTSYRDFVGAERVAYGRGKLARQVMRWVGMFR